MHRIYLLIAISCILILGACSEYIPNYNNGNGTIIAKINISSQQYAYDISSLTPGIYFIVLNHTVFKTRKK